MKLSTITQYLENLAPLSLQEAYDNSGLLLGSPDQVIKKALLSLDCTEAVLDEAIALGANLIISHHPLIFTGIKKITGANYVERVLIKAIKHDIALYAIHTNLDAIATGVNAKICEKLGLLNAQVLSPKKQVLRKLITFVPTEQATALREALFASGAGNVGNYSECSFNTEGYGTFKGAENTNPYVGDVGKQHNEPETRIECIYPIWLEKTILQTLFRHHPYEEVAYDLVTLENKHQDIGHGMIGELPTEIEAMDFLRSLKTKMLASNIRHTAIHQPKLKKVAVCGGSGSFLLPEAIAAGADVLITADFKYHQFFDAEDKIIIADIGHYETEQFTAELLLDKLSENFPTFAVHLSKVNTNPVHYL